MEAERIERELNACIEHKELAGGELLVRRGENVLYHACFGYADIEKRVPASYDTIYRLMSMTKPVTAVCVMRLYEEGRLDIAAPLSDYLPDFAGARVVSDGRFNIADPLALPEELASLVSRGLVTPDTVKARRDITVRDLLCHSSGLTQGAYGYAAARPYAGDPQTLATLEKKYARMPLDFQPGTGAGYSPMAGFDMLARLIEVVSGMTYEEYLQSCLLAPLGMTDTVFRVDDEREKRLAHLYRSDPDDIVDVSGTAEDMDDMRCYGPGYTSGAAGLYATLRDYDRFVHMLLNGGSLGGARILGPDTVRLMARKGSPEYPELGPGCDWGLGMMIRSDPSRAGSACTRGTYGWSGAYGTHFFISPADGLSAVWMMSRSNCGGAGSYISKRLEELVFGCFR